ncbi:F-box/LRR-repeat protein 25-like [Lycium barbarum]|uniref:F-box/LRR-repeat protein 25-like n=1 Tax=Lycium barbarum TaxID=112863 RepID=UPI00293F5EDB|nr:F-box/LRR-repeat protein 25-like [Lycium barbarum]XP_060208554.1 F-box/LRR-repeat protein 25-like [Lycium barbarum]XP_060208560.1 F-box/LRR-repeat protein 25-like [Lycium barbarum]XP_060208566.1 F-box/LRR-repeat protein 25-like [Lycium barbarum]XP_060208572.1 F-box/LRR-repeat protein 25-like [Lycium barbarum]
MLPDSKAVVRMSVLSTRWRFLWMSVPVSPDFNLPHRPPNGYTKKEVSDFIASANRELYYWRFCQKFTRFRCFLPRYDKSYVKDVDIWVHFATKVANVECFTLGFCWESDPIYELPQFAYNNTSLKRLKLVNCELNPSGSINWSSLVFLAIACLNLTDDVLEKVLPGCSNLESLELVGDLAVRRLEISSVKLTSLTIRDFQNENLDRRLKILAPHIKYFELLGCCDEICLQQRNVASLVSANLFLDFVYAERNSEEKCRYFKELLHRVSHVENLGLSRWCIELYYPKFRFLFRFVTFYVLLDS